MKRIDRVDVREKLPLRRDPYWYRVEEGRYVGFRRMTRGTPGSWLARYYDGERYQQKPLADYVALDEKDRFGAARKDAEEWFKHLQAGGAPRSATVKGACEAYVEDRRTNKSEAAAQDAQTRFARLVYKDPIAKVALDKLTKPQVAAWKTRVLKDGASRASFNRNATALRAALNLALENGQATSAAAWLTELRPFENADGRRTQYLDRNKRQKLVEHASEEARPLFKAMTLLPLRPGDFAKLRVQDLDFDNRILRVPSGKTKPREVPLSDTALAHFKECAKDKLPSAWIFSRTDGGQWKKEAWRDEIKLAAAGAGLPRATVAYALRHSTITDLVKSGLDLFHCAKVSGTSVKMIEAHYGQLRNEHARAALEKLALA